MLFRCSIRGENFPGEIIRCRGLVGFHTTRWVEAETAEEAEMLGLEMLRGEPTFQMSPELQSRSKAAKVYFEKIDPVRSTKRMPKNGGATWFEMD